MKSPIATPLSREAKLERETQVFAGKNNQRTRSLAWNAIPYFQQKLRERMNMTAEVNALLDGRTERRALTLACGDMKGEYGFFKSIGVTSIDAFDLSPGQRKRCFDLVYDGKIPLDYKIADVNEAGLEEGAYDIVYMQQSLHHIEAVEKVVARIHKALRPDGLFVLIDYVGEPFLQRGPKQRAVCQRIWSCLPERLRVSQDGTVRDTIWIPDKKTLSPFEAVRAPAILPAIRQHFETHFEMVFGGVVFPIVNNFAPHWDPALEGDETVLKLLWELDEMMTASGMVEPTFVRAIYRPGAAPDRNRSWRWRRGASSKP
ncbi:MAG: class I SAM-dependent methyltransferase [Pseudomonadota bacterium]